MKSSTHISWDELFIGIAELASKRSKDPSTKHGSCIVKDNKVLSIGYNGLPKGLNDDGVNTRWENCDDPLMTNAIVEDKTYYDYWDKPQKYQFACHSEENAIINAKQDLTGATIYLFSDKGYYPCATCARMIVQSGITQVIMKTATKESTDVYNWDYTKHMFIKAKVKIRILNGN